MEDPADKQRREAEEAAEKAGKQGVLSKFFVQTGQKMGVVEWTKLEPEFEHAINRLVKYHNTLFDLVDNLEACIQVDKNVLAAGKLKPDPGRNMWEVMGGWFNYLSVAHFEGKEQRFLKKYSSCCGRIGRKEMEALGSTRTHWLRKMRAYTGIESDELNDCVEQMKALIHGIDDTRHQLKSAHTTKDARSRGEAYCKMIRAFNSKAGEVQSMIDEMRTVIQVHSFEYLKFSREFSALHNLIFNNLYETHLRVNQPVGGAPGAGANQPSARTPKK
ncbi:unnamed protein product [Caenorhabditis sp. 36 PRJEB53466]|nr:unnamed protein product [Caenorhabditis sp. 36 PRJEB53466]